MIGSVGLALWGAIRESRSLQIVVAIMVGLIGARGQLAAHDAKVKRELAIQIGHANTKLATKAGDARKPAAADGSAGRVRFKYCGDCGK